MAAGERGVDEKSSRRAHFGHHKLLIYDSIGLMDTRLEALPDDPEALKAALLAAQALAREAVARADAADADLAVAKVRASEDLAMIAHQKLRIAKLERQIYGPRSERSARLIDQMELQLEEAEAAATEDEIAAEAAVAKTTTVASFTRKRPVERGVGAWIVQRLELGKGPPQ